MEIIRPKQFVLILILLTVLQWCIGTTAAFLLTGTCPVRQPCHCHGETIDCYGFNLRSIPHFYPTTLQAPFISITLAYNFLRTIPANAFRNLASLKGSFVFLELLDNRITYIDDDAFKGIEDMIGSLQLSNNHLYTLPKALATLQNLRTLYIYGNPLSSLDATVLSSLSGSLQGFGLSAHDFAQFPTEINLLTSLEGLTIDGIKVSINDNAFNGLAQTLNTLELQSAVLYYIPTAVCKLQGLEHLVWYDLPEGEDVSFDKKNVPIYVEGESDTPSTKIFIRCNNTIPSVTHFTVQDDDVILGDIFTVFPSLIYLSIEDSNLRFIDNRDIPTDAALEILYLDDNMFDNIPGALNQLANLKELYLSHNHIDAITSYDITGLTRLQILDLTGNPLKYIAVDSFARNHNLNVLILDDTDLAVIPAAITSLRSLSALHLTTGTLHCDCATLSNVTSWNVDAITFPSFCDQSVNTTIKSFIKDAVPKCP